MRAVSSIGVLLLLLLAAQQAFGGEPTEAEKESARVLLDEGDARIEQADLEGALRAYEAADVVMHVPTTGIEVAKTLERLGRLAEADRAARGVIEHPQPADEPVEFSEARRQAQALRERIAIHIAPPPPPAPVVAPAPLPLSRPLPSPPVHDDDSPWSSPLGWSGVALATAGVALGVGFGVATIVKTDAIERRCGGLRCPASEQRLVDEAEAFANVSNVGFVVAGVGAALAIVGFITAGDAPPANAAASFDAPVLARW
jgi:hypothetical protein